MAVIINEFEVVVEPEATAPGEQSQETVANEESVASQTLTPYDFDSILRQRRDRYMRIRAH